MFTVGEFEYHPEHHSIIGPKQYLDEQGEALLQRIAAGEDFIFNLTAHQSPDAMTAVLVRLQTDYAGWLGAKQLMDALGLAPLQPQSHQADCECCNTKAKFVPDPDGACARCGHDETEHLEWRTYYENKVDPTESV